MTAVGTSAYATRTRPADHAAHHDLVCSVCFECHSDDGLLLRCPGDHAPGFLRTRYAAATPRPSGALPERGLARFAGWLPVRRPIADTAGQAVVHRSRALGARLGLDDLWIAFSGYWPERGANLCSGTFKELEAYTVLARIPDGCPPLVVPSVGNTAAAFAAAFSETGRPCVLVVPRSGLHRLALRRRSADSIGVVVLDGATYHDCISVAERACRTHGLHAAGGAWNVARRDGLGTVSLAAAETMAGNPDVYVQAIGSGVGAIAAWEAVRRLGGPRPRMLLCQNAEDAAVLALHGRLDPVRDGVPFADELLNPQPPYAVTGGLRDVLDDTGGAVLTATHAAAADARRIFAQDEGIDIEPAPAVALAALARAVREGLVRRDERVLLNVTGGGRARLRADHHLYPVAVHDLVDLHTDGEPAAVDAVARVAGSLRVA